MSHILLFLAIMFYKKINHICQLCLIRIADHRHHKLSQTKLFRKIYPEFIDHPDNILHYCATCHNNKSIIKWSEREFCEHFNIKIRSKSGK